MKDLWLRSESMNDRDGYDDLPAPALLSGWWGISLTWGVLEPVVAANRKNPLQPQTVGREELDALAMPSPSAAAAHAEHDDE